MINTSVKYPNSLIKFLRKEEKDIVIKLFQKESIEEVDIENQLSKFILPVSGFFQKELNYDEILNRLMKKVNINFNSNESVQEKEEKILLFKFKKLFESLSEDEKAKFENEILKYSKEKGINKDQALSINAISTLTLANISGFSLYLMASTIVGGLTSILGITLPFVFYTSMSTVLSVVTGPIGWTVGLGYLAYSFRNDNFQSATEKIKNYGKGIKNSITGNIEHSMLIVSFLASCRIILKEEKQERKIALEKHFEKLKKQNEDLKSENYDLARKIQEFENKLQTNKVQIENNEEKSFELEVNIRKINNFINQTS